MVRQRKIIEMKRVTATFLAALFLTCAARSAAAPLRISYAAIAANIAGIWMAEGSGAFKKYGLDVQFVYIPSSGTNVQALLGGSIDVMVAGSSGIVSAAARGAPLVAIGSQMNRPPVTLYVQPDIIKPDQLRNQVLGITRFGSSTHALSTLVLRKLGLEKTVTLRPLGETPAVQAAFEQKMIAGMLTTVKPRIAARPLVNAADLDIPYPMSIIGVTQTFLQANRETLDRLLRAYVEGVAMMVHDKERAVKILAQYLRRSDPAFLDETYTLVRTYTERVPRFDSRAIPILLEFDQAKGVTADALAAKVIDNSLVDQLVAEKFIEKSFGKELR
jgi:putative hydroxymethylpyrimidine transport system substrate-binding protein